MENQPDSGIVGGVVTDKTAEVKGVPALDTGDFKAEDKPKKPRKKRQTAKEKLKIAEDLKKEAIDEMNKEAEEANSNSVSLHVANLVSRGMSMKDAIEKAKG